MLVFVHVNVLVHLHGFLINFLVLVWGVPHREFGVRREVCRGRDAAPTAVVILRGLGVIEFSVLFPVGAESDPTKTISFAIDVPLNAGPGSVPAGVECHHS